MRIIFMGTPEFAVPHLEQLVLNQYEVVAVYTRPDRPAGRGQTLASSPVKRAARALKLPVVQPVSLKARAAIDELKGFSPDVIVVAGFGQILPQAVLDIPRYGCLNVHPSLLPRFRGASPVAAAVLAGDDFTGVSIMLVSAALDSGPVLTRAQIPVSAQDTTDSLTSKLSRVGARVLLDTLVYWLRGELNPRPQNEAGATICSLVTREKGEVDWHLRAVDIWRQVRAFHPWPGSYTSWRGKQLKILEAVPLPGEGSLEVGEVVALARKEAGIAFGINTGDGVLGVLRVQLEGKRGVSSAEFLRGQRQFIGAILPSG
mgnify:CR=1 FL=1